MGDSPRPARLVANFEVYLGYYCWCDFGRYRWLGAFAHFTSLVVMTFVLIIGRPGGGKTYTAFKDYIIPAIKEGRRVLHNIPGLKDGDNFGTYPLIPDVNLTHDGDFRFSPVSQAHADSHRYVKPGDLLVIDEFYLVRRVAEDALSDFVLSSRSRARTGDTPFIQHFNAFLRAHRHYTGGGNACDILVLTQSDNELPACLQNCAERTIVMKTHPIRTGVMRALHFDGFQRQQTAKGAFCLYQNDVTPHPSVYNRYSSYTFGVAKENYRGFSKFRIFRRIIVISVFCLVGIFVLIPGSYAAFTSEASIFGTKAKEYVGIPSSVTVITKPKNPPFCRLVINGVCRFF